MILRLALERFCGLVRLSAHSRSRHPLPAARCQMPLSEAELARHDALARAFVRHLRALLSREVFEEIELQPTEGKPVLVVRVPAASSTVGDLLVYSDGTELTSFVGDHSHEHWGAYLFGKPGDPAACDKAAVAVAEWVRQLLADRVVVWSRRAEDRRILAGGTQAIADSADVQFGLGRLLATEAWLWSGRRVPIRRGGHRA